MLERTVMLANIWAAESNRSLSRLATIVVNDGKLFERIAGGGSCTVATLEKLVSHLGDPTNWPAEIPAEAANLLASFQPNVPRETV